MPAFPATLPAPLVGGYGLEPVDQTRRTDMEKGAARVRRITAADNDRVSCAWLFSAAQFVTFRDWHRSDIAGGATWFDIDLDLGGGLALATARFVGNWKAAREGRAWKITAQLEIN